KTVAEHEKTVAEHEKTVAEHEKTVAVHKKTVAELEETVAGNKKSVAEHEKTVSELQEVAVAHEKIVAEYEKLMAADEETDHRKATERLMERLKAGEKLTARDIPLDQILRLNDDLVKVFVQNPNEMDIKTMEVQMESEGLLINILNNPDKPIFKEGSAAELTEYGQVVFNNIAWTIARYDDPLVEVEGHTATSYPGDPGEKWDASTQRAHKAREILMNKGVEETQVIKVAGYADKRPLPKRPPGAGQNNRV
ncbi:uncharacterized protein METZ01_LOCUS459741, partial [marine metagenome]